MYINWVSYDRFVKPFVLVLHIVTYNLITQKIYEDVCIKVSQVIALLKPEICS